MPLKRQSVLSIISIPIVLFALFVPNHSASAQTIAESCRVDLDSLPDFLLQNDAGAWDSIARQGKNLFARTLTRAQGMIGTISTEGDCLKVLDGYVQTYRHGQHIWITPVASDAVNASDTAGQRNDGPDPSLPTFHTLSARTVLITIPSFYLAYADKLRTLIEKHKKDLASHPNLIIDVHRNGGGSDDSFAPLMPYLLANSTRTFGAEYLATEANIKGREEICGSVPYMPDTEECRRLVAPSLALLRNAKSGEFVRFPGMDASGSIASVEKVTRNPRRVGILMGKDCGSSCDQFLLNARQSFKVKLFGRPSLGSVDYSNMESHTLPSGKRSLGYAISRSLRLPEMPVDTGIQPDQLLKEPADEAAYAGEIDQVQRILESAR